MSALPPRTLGPAPLWRALPLLVLGACSGPPPSTVSAAPVETAPPSTGPVVATVDGEPITLDDVEAAMRASGLSALDALHRLEEERALYRRARTRADDADPEVERAVRRASVQALLRARVEAPIGEDSVSDAEIAARYEATRASWARPERRASVHVLAAPREPGDAAASAAAERFVRGAIARLVAASDPAAEAEAIGGEGDAGRTFSVRVETLPATSRDGALAAPYLAALFAATTAPAVVPEPVHTSFGTHAIVLTSIAPAFEVSLEEATPILRRQLVAEHRAAALDALATELATRTHVAVDERRVASVLAVDLGASAP